MPPFWSTINKIVSPSQSKRISRTVWKCPDSSPLCQSFFRERDQYTDSPFCKVCSKASWFIQAIIKTSPDEASWAITGTKPCSFHTIRSSHGPACKVGLLTNLDVVIFYWARSVKSNRNSVLCHIFLSLLHTVLSVMKNTRR